MTLEKSHFGLRVRAIRWEKEKEKNKKRRRRRRKKEEGRRKKRREESRFGTLVWICVSLELDMC